MGRFLEALKSEQRKEFVRLLATGEADSPAAAYGMAYNHKNKAQWEERAGHLLLLPAVASALDELKIEHNVKCGHTLERLINELMTLAYFTMEDIVDENGEVKCLKDVPSQVFKCVKSVEEITRWEGRRDNKVPVRTYKLKFWSKEKAIELLGKNLGAYIEKMQVEGEIRTEVEIVQALFAEVAMKGGKALPETAE
jgi:phage terminase small subunit